MAVGHVLRAKKLIERDDVVLIDYSADDLRGGKQ